jgi:hypothetical protein
MVKKRQRGVCKERTKRNIRRPKKRMGGNGCDPLRRSPSMRQPWETHVNTHHCNWHAVAPLLSSPCFEDLWWPAKGDDEKACWTSWNQEMMRLLLLFLFFSLSLFIFPLFLFFTYSLHLSWPPFFTFLLMVHHLPIYLLTRIQIRRGKPYVDDP